MLSRLGPKRKPRRRSLPLPKYDQLVALAEAPMHRRGMTISTAPPWVPPRTSLPLRLKPAKQPLSLLNWTCMPWTSLLMLTYGPGVGSPRRLLDELLGCGRVARSSPAGALPVRLPRRMPVGAEPGPKSGPCFCVPSQQTPCQARGARVAGCPASGPAEAAYAALCQLAHSCAKPRGRQFPFLPGVFAAPCCPCHTHHLTQADPVTVITTLRSFAGAPCQQLAPQSAPAGCRSLSYLPSLLLAGLLRDSGRSQTWSPQIRAGLLPQQPLFCCRRPLDDTLRTVGWSLILDPSPSPAARPQTTNVLSACQLLSLSLLAQPEPCHDSAHSNLCHHLSHLSLPLPVPLIHTSTDQHLY